MYGLFLYSKSIFFNASVGATVTAAGRNVISTSALTVEEIGNGYRSYLIEAHLQIIEVAKSESAELNSKYTLPRVDVETVLKHMLLYHYDGYYALSFLRHTLEQLTPEELSTVYMKNNFKEFVKVPEVSAVIEDIYKENCKWREELSEHDTKVEDLVCKVFKRMDSTNKEKMKKSYIVGYSKHPIYGALAKKLKKMSGELLMGFYFYSGDYINGSYRETSVDIFEHMERVKIPTADTDSNVSCVFDECEYMNEVFNDYIKDDEFIEEVATTVITTIIFTGSIDKSLDRYTKAIGVSSDYSHLIEMEEETTMSDLQLTTGKKKYVFGYFIQDGNFNVKVYDTIKIKGMQSIKSDYNADICERVNDIFNRKVMAKLDELNYKEVITEAKELTEYIDSTIKSDDYILHKSTIKKSNKSSEELAFGDSKNKMARLWKRFNLDGEIDYPGSYRELDIKFSEPLLESIKDEFPEIYIALVEHVSEIKLFEFYRNCINGARKFMDGNGKIDAVTLRTTDSLACDVIVKFCSNVIKLNPDQLDERFAKRMSYDMFKDINEESFTKLVRKVLGLGPRDVVHWSTENRDVVMNISNQDIIDNIEKLALPIDINIVPEFIKLNDYELIDAEFAATGEFLLGGLTDTLGISCPRNSSDKMLISSALQSY